MKNNQTPKWLENLILEESQLIAKNAKKYPIVKLAQSKEEKMKDLEKKIDEAESPEELDEIEKELTQLESESSDDGTDDDKSADMNENDTESENDEESDDEEKTGDIDLSDIYKEVKDVKNDVGDEKENIQRKLLNQLDHLNDQLGLNKIVDLNSTIDTGM